MPRTLIKPLFFLFGVGLFVWALLSVNMKDVGVLLLKLGLNFFIIQAVYTLVTIADTYAWQYNFKPEEAKKFNAWQLWRIRQVGEAFNTITPFGTLGGEPVKAQLLKDHHVMSFKQALAASIIARTTLLMALTLFLIPGNFLIVSAEFLSPAFKHASLVGLSVFSLAIFLFFLFQLTNSLKRVMNVLSKWPVVGKLISRQLHHIEVLDEHIASYYKQYPWRVVVSVLFGLIGWLVGIAELYLIFHFLGYDIDFKNLWIIEALGQLIRVGSFFIPLSLGALEGGLILVFAAMGLPGHLGLTVSLIHRIKQILWVGLGLALGSGMVFNKPKAKIKAEPKENL